MKLSTREVETIKKRIKSLANSYSDINQNALRHREGFAQYGMNNGLGKAIYKYYSDDELLDILRQRAALLGHSPAQGEMFFAYRDYIKVRFRRWPMALKSAGLPKSAGKGGSVI